jgi:hypothetical protein
MGLLQITRLLLVAKQPRLAANDFFRLTKTAQIVAINR